MSNISHSQSHEAARSLMFFPFPDQVASLVFFPPGSLVCYNGSPQEPTEDDGWQTATAIPRKEQITTGSCYTVVQVGIDMSPGSTRDTLYKIVAHNCSQQERIVREEELKRQEFFPHSLVWFLPLELSVSPDAAQKQEKCSLSAAWKRGIIVSVRNTHGGNKGQITSKKHYSIQEIVSRNEAGARKTADEEENDDYGDIYVGIPESHLKFWSSDIPNKEQRATNTPLYSNAGCVLASSKDCSRKREAVGQTCFDENRHNKRGKNLGEGFSNSGVNQTDKDNRRQEKDLSSSTMSISEYTAAAGDLSSTKKLGREQSPHAKDDRGMVSSSKGETTATTLEFVIPEFVGVQNVFGALIGNKGSIHKSLSRKFECYLELQGTVIEGASKTKLQLERTEATRNKSIPMLVVLSGRSQTLLMECIALMEEKLVKHFQDKRLRGYLLVQLGRINKDFPHYARQHLTSGIIHTRDPWNIKSPSDKYVNFVLVDGQHRSRLLGAGGKHLKMLRSQHRTCDIHFIEGYVKSHNVPDHILITGDDFPTVANCQESTKHLIGWAQRSKKSPYNLPQQREEQPSPSE
jgi:hypothetical protein